MNNEVFIPLAVSRSGGVNIWSTGISNRARVINNRDIFYKFRLTVSRSEDPYFDNLNWNTSVNSLASYINLRYLRTQNIFKIVIILEFQGAVVTLANATAYTERQFRGILDNTVARFITTSLTHGIVPQSIRETLSGEDSKVPELLFNAENINDLKISIVVYERFNATFQSHPLPRFISAIWNTVPLNFLRNALQVPAYPLNN